ncbi:MAG TPA: 3,4-dihydroxy-2-butanone-4-phosphate synthase, partial [Dehalococcoidia bacterium]|nr:3,4-dihydroxy-2-butanone-4-phosphate synthase [Dehalococcoidia bacterium]
MPLSSLEEAIADLQAGKFVIVVDDERRENEGDLVMAAEKVTPQAVNFMVTHARGLLCMPMIEERLNELAIPMVGSEHTENSMPTAFTMSIDYNIGTTTGISAYDRAATVLALVDEKSSPADFSRPGHLFPLKYHPGGVLARAGHTEAIIDLCNIGAMYPAGVVCEIMKDDGEMAR